MYTLGLGSEGEIRSQDLRRLADSTRGQYYPARRADQLRAIYEQIAERIGSSYVLTYQTDRTLPDGTLRPIRVSYRGGRSGGEAAVFIPGMVVPAGGWSPLFLGLDRPARDAPVPAVLHHQADCNPIAGTPTPLAGVRRLCRQDRRYRLILPGFALRRRTAWYYFKKNANFLSLREAWICVKKMASNGGTPPKELQSWTILLVGR